MFAILLVGSLLIVGTQQSSFAQCGRHKTGRIIGGWSSGVNEYPMVAGLTRGKSHWVFCSATIVSHNHALTAAHCVQHHLAKDVQMLVGSSDYSKYPDTKYSKRYSVNRFIIHPRFGGVGVNDVALVKTVKTIAFNAAVGPVCLPKGNDQYAGRIVEMLGWGMTRNAGSLSNVLQKTQVHVMRNNDCAYYYGSFVQPTHICTFTQGRDFCTHDSGGPLFVETNGRVTLVGIIGYGGCLQGKPGGSLRVTPYVRWIEDAIKH